MTPRTMNYSKYAIELIMTAPTPTHLSGLSLDATSHQLPTCRIHSQLSWDVHGPIYQDSLAGRQIEHGSSVRVQIVGFNLAHIIIV